MKSVVPILIVAENAFRNSGCAMVIGKKERKKERKKNKTQYNYFFFVVIAMMEVTNHKRTVVSISSRYVDLTEIFLKNYFHVN